MAEHIRVRCAYVVKSAKTCSSLKADRISVRPSHRRIALGNEERQMNAREMLEKVQELKESVIFNGFSKTKEIDDFLNEHWMQILDILDDALYQYLNK